MKNYIIFSFFIVLSVASINAWYPYNCTGQENNQTVYQGTPQFVAKVKNGEKWAVEYDNRTITFLKLYGNATEMGYAYGTLMVEELQDQVTNLFQWMQAAINPADPALPVYFRNALANGTISFQKYKFYVDLYYTLYTKNYTPQRFIDELQGISAATNISFSDLMGINIVPELIKAQCSLIGAWGPATQYSQGGDLIQLRSLDFGHGTSPMSKYPQLTFYHSTEPGSYPFANVGWAGIVGSITGYSNYIGVSEASRDVLSNLTSRYGIPWTFALRDTLQFCKNLDEALIYLNSTTKTCSIYVGIGQSGRGVPDNQPDYRIVEYSNSEFTILSDKNMSVMNPDIDNVVGYLQEVENSNWCFLNSITPSYGNITEETIRQACAYDETGDSQVTIMNFRTQNIVLAYPTWKPIEMGYTQPAVQVNLGPFLEDMNKKEIQEQEKIVDF